MTALLMALAALGGVGVGRLWGNFVEAEKDRKEAHDIRTQLRKAREALDSGDLPKVVKNLKS